MQLESSIARLIRVGTYTSVALLAVGVVLLLATGHSPLEGGPGLDTSRIIGDLVGLRPDGFLWLGLAVAIGTPVARVAVALARFIQREEREMAVVAALVLAVIVLSVTLALATEG